MIDKMDKELCTGCNACYSVCPNNCIEMIEEGTGFRYPKVDYSKCIKCKSCIETCPSLNSPSLIENTDNPKIFAAWSLDETVRFHSTSGGLFTELAKEVMKEGGLVVGAAYNDKHLVEHLMINNINDIEKLRQSKYVQSDIGDIFKSIEEKLMDGNLIAFCGSPCQVAGLLNYLRKPYHNLMTFDFVCRGTNSPKAYLKYIEMLENKYKSKIAKIWFKNKTYGWNRFSTKIYFANKKEYLKDRYDDLYMRGYIEENLYMRPCCFNCKYKEFPRVSDITLADFWGVGKENPEMDYDKGTSLVMINTQKGSEIFCEIQSQIFYKESMIEIAMRDNNAIAKSAIKNPNSDDFLKMLDEYEFDECFKKYARNVGYIRLKNKVRRIGGRIKRTLKSKLKRF